jgi:hypothetical protein
MTTEPGVTLEGHQLRPLARVMAGILALVEVAFLATLTFGFAVPLFRSLPDLPTGLLLSAGVFLAVACLAQLLLVPLFWELYRFPD